MERVLVILSLQQLHHHLILKYVEFECGRPVDLASFCRSLEQSLSIVLRLEVAICFHQSYVLLVLDYIENNKRLLFS